MSCELKEMILNELKLLRGRCFMDENSDKLIASRIGEIEECDLLVESCWTWETGRWDDGIEKFVDRRDRTEVRAYRVKVADGKLTFMDGPTGYEAYRLEDVARHDGSTLCINAGSINSWPMVTVQWRDVQRLVLEALCQ